MHWREPKYTLIRYYKSGERKTMLQTGLTLKQAQAYCKQAETSSKTCRLPKNVKHTEMFGEWFDGYVKEQ